MVFFFLLILFLIHNFILSFFRSCFLSFFVPFSSSLSFFVPLFVPFFLCIAFVYGLKIAVLKPRNQQSFIANKHNTPIESWGQFQVHRLPNIICNNIWQFSIYPRDFTPTPFLGLATKYPNNNCDKNASKCWKLWSKITIVPNKCGKY